MVKLHYAVIIMLMVTCVAFAQENATNQTNETVDSEDDYIQQGKGILEGMYNNYKMIFTSFANATGIEAEAVSAILAVALIFVLLGKRARKYLFYAMAIFVVLFIVGLV